MKTKESFTSYIKEELVTNEYNSFDRLKALLAAYIRINGSLILRNKEIVVSLTTENAKIGKFIYTTINRLYDADAKLNIYSKSNLSKKSVYNIVLGKSTKRIIDDLEISFLEGKISRNIVRNDDTISGYLAGAFLASGSINSPETSNYHLEISVSSQNYAKWLSKLFSKYKNSYIEPKIIERRGKWIIYFKKSDQISNFLIMIGAVSSCLEFEDVRANRDLMNNANRLTNMDTANMKKTYENAMRQIEEINLIDKRLGIENLTTLKMRTLCKLRLENEGASLQELSVLLSEAMGKPVSKSNVNHLFRSLHQVYEKLNYDDWETIRQKN